MSATLSQEISEESQLRITGCVKWFNNKAGFGFVTAVEGDLKEKDVFVHYSAINVPDDQYKYLVQGEYVDFELSDSEKNDHEFHAVNVSGVKGGSLMCETRRQSSETRPYKPRVYKTPDENDPAKRKYISKRGQINESDGYTKVSVQKPKTNSK